MTSLLSDITAPYEAREAWFYDTIIAPAVGSLHGAAVDELLAELPTGARILEVGCGGGQLAIKLAERRPDLSIVGLDLSHEQVARAQGRARASAVALGDRLQFVQGSALELPFPDQSFDGVFSVASIKHWPDQLRGLRECVRVLRDGGGLAVAEADRGCRFDDARAFVALWRIPAFMRPIALAMFRTFVAGQGIDLDDGRALLAALPLAEPRVARIPGAPAVLLRGKVKRS